jgi:valyl-tRNA synthetase
MFAPIMPFVTEEVWSWWREGSIHRASWPEPQEIRSGGDPSVLHATAGALHGIRGLKSARKLSMRAELDRAVIVGPAAELGFARLARDDLVAAGRVRELHIIPNPAVAQITVESAVSLKEGMSG